MGLTAARYEWEFDEAAEWLAQIDAPKVVVPGNHDSRNVGYVHFERLFGDRFSRYRRAFETERAEPTGHRLHRGQRGLLGPRP